jgi:preprotein translocase subunit SecA
MIIEEAMTTYEENEKLLPESTIREMERIYLLQSVDTHWMDHIDNMEQLKEGIHLRSYGQHDPVVVYTSEGFDMFEEMLFAIHEDTARLMLTQPKRVYESQRRKEAILVAKRLAAQRAAEMRADMEKAMDTEDEETQIPEIELKRKQVAQPTYVAGDGTDSRNRTVRKNKKVGRNDPCPCGSGKKYKKCCGRDE